MVTTRADADEQASRFAAHVAEALHRHFGAFNLHAQTLGHFAAGDEHAAAGRFLTAQEPPRWIGLPVTTPVMVVPWFME